MKILPTRNNALGIAFASLVISFATFFTAHFFLLGYERDLASVVELWMFAVFAAVVFFILIIRNRMTAFNIFSVMFIAACLAYLITFADRNNTFATLTGSLFYIYIILIGSIVSILVDFLLTIKKKRT